MCDLNISTPHRRRWSAKSDPSLNSASKYSRGGSRASSRNAGYHFQRFKGEGQEDASVFESATALSLEAAEVLCSRMRGGIAVEVCTGCRCAFGFCSHTVDERPVYQRNAGRYLYIATVANTCLSCPQDGIRENVYRLKSRVYFRIKPW